MTINRKIVNRALGCIGIREGSLEHKFIIDEYNKIKPLPRGYKVTYKDSWCAAFVSFIMKQCGVDNFPFECGVAAMEKLFDNRGLRVKNRKPFYGEVGIFNYSHVGIIQEVTDTRIHTVEGNKSDSVAFGVYSYSSFRGFFMPYQYSTNDLAEQVMNGMWGNGQSRKDLLTKCGYDYQTIQDEVNRRFKSNAN